ncbi:MAG TPA: nucleoside deaminase [Clostridiales bacterium]|nr:nucleoside deaminase [Clostridiales bacterium]
MSNKNNEFMEAAYKLAKQAADIGEVPVGAVVVHKNTIVGTGINRRETEKNALCHAEIEAINNACKSLDGWRLWDCELYVTLEPCPMCTGAIINSRIKRVVFGAYDKKSGSCGSVINLLDYPYNHKPVITGGYMEDKCAELLTDFFKKLRYKKNSKEGI